ncbi:hypothetical protein HanHA300_Chr11g0402701 [Helianthus annuus]|nr:hypothetical protein HanHA300_Chr11g0402701 [Helianthus annuus]
MRMGYTGFVNDQAYTKSKLSKPYKFFVHSVIHALGHIKGAYDESVDYIMNIITCLILNRPYNISQVIFNHMLDNIKGECFLQCPRFVHMLLNDQIPNLLKVDGDELKLIHMDNETLKRLDVYRGIEEGKEPKFRKKFAAIEKADYQALEDDKWRHDNSGSDDETKKMEQFVPKKTRWWVKKDEKQKKETPTPRTPKAVTPKAAPKKKKSPPHLVDEPDANVEAAAGGEKSGKNIEAMKETLVKGEVHSDSSETESDIEVTKMAPTSYVSGKFRMKGPSRKKKGSDEGDATYEPSASEKEKLKKTKGLRKHKAQPTGDVLRKQKARKITTSNPEQIPEVERVENVEVEIPVQSEFRMATPPASPTPESIPVQVEVHVTTPEQPAKTVEEPRSTTKKIPTPRQEGSSSGFPKVPSNLDAAPIGLEDFGDFFNDAKVNELSKKVAVLEKSKVETEENLKQVEAENVVLKNEILAMQDQIEDVKAGNNALNEAIDELLVENCDLNEANTTISNANEILQKEIKDLKVKDENKSKQIEMLYVVIEDKLGINVHAAFDEIEIRIAEARRMEKEQKDAEETVEALKDKGKGVVVDTEEILGSSSQQEQPQLDAEVNVANVAVNVADVERAIVLAQQFIRVGETIDVPYNEEETKRRDEIKRQKEKKKDMKVDEEDEEDDEKDKESEDWFDDIDNYHGDDDNDDDDD